MHLMVTHASAQDDAVHHAIATLTLPNLAALLSRLTLTGEWGDDEFNPQTTPDQAMAALRELGAPCGAAWRAALHPDFQAAHRSLRWAAVTPLHLSVGPDQFTALPPNALQLDTQEAELWLATLREVWPESQGWVLLLNRPRADEFEALLGHAKALDGLEAASVERVFGRPIEPWLPQDRALRRWQNEVQMMMHDHPINRERESQGRPVLNAVWIGEIGKDPVAEVALEARLDESLRLPLLAGDLAAWAEAFQALDAGSLATLRQRAEAGEPVSLTLCGGRRAKRWDNLPVSVWGRLRRGLQGANDETTELLQAL